MLAIVGKRVDLDGCALEDVIGRDPLTGDAGRQRG